MPISKFAVQIAHALVDYLETDNPVTLPAGYAYGKDNSAVLNPYSAANLTQKATGLASTVAASAVNQAMYSFGFWSAPSAPSPGIYNTPATSSYLTIPGVEGIDRALQIAKHFGLIQNATQGKNLVEILQSSSTGRRSELLNDHGFNIIHPDNRLLNDITRADCDCILSFITHTEKWHEKTSGRRVLEVIRKQLHIHSRDVAEEKRALQNAYIEMPMDDDKDEDYQIVGEMQYALSDTHAPAELCTPDKALLKLIYDRTTELKASIVDEMLISTQHPDSSRHSLPQRTPSFKQSTSSRSTSMSSASSTNSVNSAISSQSSSAQSRTSSFSNQ